MFWRSMSKKNCCFSICNVIELNKYQRLQMKAIYWLVFDDDDDDDEKNKNIPWIEKALDWRSDAVDPISHCMQISVLVFVFFFQLLYFAFVSRFLWLSKKVSNATNSLSHDVSTFNVLIAELVHRSDILNHSHVFILKVYNV